MKRVTKSDPVTRSNIYCKPGTPWSSSRVVSLQVVQLLKGDNGLDVKQKSMGERTLHIDACDMEDYASRTLNVNVEAGDVEDYTSATYLNELNRHMQLLME